MTLKDVAILRGLSSFGKEPIQATFTVEATHGLSGATATLEVVPSSSLSHECLLDDFNLTDLLRLSICLHTIANREDTSEELPDIEGGADEVVKAQWFMGAFLMKECFVEMTSWNPPRNRGTRVITFLLEMDDRPDCFQTIAILCKPEDVLHFARDLRKSRTSHLARRRIEPESAQAQAYTG
jgi:hypothetical protein